MSLARSSLSMSRRRNSPALCGLRAATAATHEGLDSGLHLALPGAGHQTYAQFAAAMWGWLQPIETSVWSGGWPAQVDVPARAVKSRWLEEDLERARHDGYLEGEIMRREPRFAFRTLSERMGAAYAIECLMLGVPILQRRLAPSLFPWRARFLIGYGADHDERWNAFLGVIDAHLYTQARIEDATRSAARTFDTLATWLRAQGAA